MNDSTPINIRCPWIEEHSCDSGPTETVYFPVGTGGFEQGHFRCLHASHEHKTDADFLEAIGWSSEGFQDISTQDVIASFDTRTDAEKAAARAVLNPLEAPNFKRNPSTQAVKVLLYNVVLALQKPEWCKILVRYDAFLSTIMIGPPDQARPIRPTDLSAINMFLTTHNFGPGAISNEMIGHAVEFVAKEREFDSAIDWLNGLPPWDGTERIEHFCHRYLGSEDTPYHRAVSRYWWSAHAGRVLRPAGVQADAAIILVSAQGTGKTTTLKNMVPDTHRHVEISLHATQENIIRKMKGRLIVELAELQGLKSRDAESIKALISAMGDTFVDKYEKYAQDVVRRCVFVGSSNNDDFLSDHTGNRRFLPVYVGAKQQLSRIVQDRDQLWAEGKVLFELLDEVDWKDAQRLVLVEHCKFEETDVWEERVGEWLDDASNWELMHSGGSFVTCARALSGALHMDTSKQAARDMHRMVRIFVRFGLVRCNHRVSGHLTRIWIRKENNDL